MINLTAEQTRNLTVWAYERLWDAVDTHKYDGDMWFTVDSAVPELEGKIDVNIWDDGENGSKVQAAAYLIDTLADGTPNTNTAKWAILF